MLDSLQNISVILGSGSPRRRDLLAGLGITFEVKVSDVEEIVNPYLSPQEVVEDLACQKGLALVADLEEDQLLITSDTVVVHRSEILGKPADEAAAIEMIDRIQGDQHQVMTGVALWLNGRSISFHEVTDVFFDPLTLEEISNYVTQHQPLDKAGSYGIQEWVGYVGIRRLEGCYYNVMGLPLNRLYKELKTFLAN